MKHLQLTDDLQEQASLYAVGALPESESAEYARHIEEDQCTVCREAVGEYQSVTALLAYTLPDARPSPSVKTRLMEQARNSASPAKRQSGFFRLRWLELTTTAAAIAAILVMAVVMRTNAELRQLTDQLSGRITELEARLSQERVNVAYLTDPRNRVINLVGQGNNAGARGVIFWNQSRRRWSVYVRDLPQVPSDRAYQLWFVPKNGNPVSEAVFNTENNGTKEIQIDLTDGLPDLKAAAVTTEPAGGLLQPSGAFALLGE
jgi:anti-sigma-K factor RskA